MKKNEFREMKNESIEKLNELIKTNKKTLDNLYLEKSINKLKNTRKIFNIRKDIAKMITLVNQKRSK